jgi:tRNA nucleotidyltransferase (CCA-adding enzyme)
MNANAGNASGAEAIGCAPPSLDVCQALRDQPGGRELLELAATRPDVALVGGAVRDLLLGRAPRELDVAVDGESAQFARALAASLDTPVGRDVRATEHERFRTATVAWEGGRIDVAERRAEAYREAGALPDVRAGSIEQDLQRRDFTVNAICVPLGGPQRGQPIPAEHALEDLAASKLRVLHPRSFTDDPTRLLRLARYSARLGFEAEPNTARLAAEALAAGALAAVSPARVGAELRLALGEPDPVAAFASLDRLGVFAALERRLRFDPTLARDALALLPEDGRADLTLVALLLLGVAVDPRTDPEPVMFDLLDGWELPAADRERVTRTALVAPSLEKEMELAETPSELHDALFAHTIEAVAVGGALGNAASAARQWIQVLRHVQLEIGGADLLAAGVPSGPEIGRRLSAALARKLDGELMDGREMELRAAMEDEL